MSQKDVDQAKKHRAWLEARVVQIDNYLEKNGTLDYEQIKLIEAATEALKKAATFR
jgi:hypothetical protein